MGERVDVVVLCPGQGAQAVGMGRAWAEASAAAMSVFDEADAILGDSLGAPLSELCFSGPAEVLNRTDVSQPAIYTCSVVCWEGLRELGESWSIAATSGLSLGEYTALHLAGVFDFAQGLRLVSVRGQLMQQAAEDRDGGMVALIGATEEQAMEVCDQARKGGVLVCANFNAPGQIVLSGDSAACQRASEVGPEMGLRATVLKVAGAFHSPHMQSAADGLADVLQKADLSRPRAETWSNVTAEAHDPTDLELLRQRLVEQLISPVRWDQSCLRLVSQGTIGYQQVQRESIAFHELAPGSVLRGLMRRIDRDTKVTSHDEPK